MSKFDQKVGWSFGYNCFLAITEIYIILYCKFNLLNCNGENKRKKRRKKGQKLKHRCCHQKQRLKKRKFA